MMMAHRQGNSQRGVGTACHSEAGSHNQGCHWRKCLESCIETQKEGQKARKEGGVTGRDTEKRPCHIQRKVKDKQNRTKDGKRERERVEES